MYHNFLLCPLAGTLLCKQVAAELSDSLKVLFNQGKYAPLIRLVQGASEALGAVAAHGRQPPTASGSAGGAAGSGAAVSASEQARREAEQLLWDAKGLSVASWLVVALENVEGQFRGVGLGLLMDR